MLKGYVQVVKIFWLFRADFNVVQTNYPFCSPYSFLHNNWIIPLPPLWLWKHYLLAIETKGTLANKSANGTEDGAVSSYSLRCGLEREKVAKLCYRGWNKVTVQRLLWLSMFLTRLLCQNLLLLHQSQDGSVHLWFHHPSSVWQVHVLAVTIKSARVDLSECLISRMRKKFQSESNNKLSFFNDRFVKNSKKIAFQTTQKSVFSDLAWEARGWIGPERKILENVCCSWRLL